MTKDYRDNFVRSNAISILECLPCGVFTVDDDMRITYFNTAAENITGVPREKAIGQYCYDVFKTNICEKRCILSNSLETDRECKNVRADILRSDGRRVAIRLCTSILKDEHGNKKGGVEIFQDILVEEQLKEEIKKSYVLEDIVSKNHRMKEIFDILPNVAESDSTVLIQGASGSGKELFARAIHNMSRRKNGPFVAVNCSALPETLLESELFGYEKGAFTDAKKDKPGRFALAKHGTLFLDEVDSLTPAMQVKLLRVLQEKEYEPLGATGSVKADVRIIAATKEDLATLVSKGFFRDDLYFRLNIVRIIIPPLRERREDIPLLVEHFVRKFNYMMGKEIARVSDDVLSVLINYDFPGNVRELENIIEHAFVMCREDIIQLHHLPPEISNQNFTPHYLKDRTKVIENAEQKLLLIELEKHNWNKVKTAKALGIDRTTLWRKMKKYGLM